MSENPDIDSEIGLTEEEIKEITNDTSLGADFTDLEDVDYSESLHEDTLGDGPSQDYLSERSSPKEGLMEEIDLSDLDDEIETIDLDEPSQDEEVDKIEEDLRFKLKKAQELGNAPLVQPAEPDIPGLEIPDDMKNIEDPSPSRNKEIPSQRKSRPKPVQRPGTKSSPKISPRVSKPTSSAPSTKTTPTQSKSVSSWEDTENMKDLFQYLDELLTYVPEDKLKDFALSKAYETYFSLLKKLGI